MFKKLISEVRELVEGAGLPGKLSKKYDRGSRGADSFRTFTKKQTNRARRRAEKKMLADTPTRMTKGYSHGTWPSNPVYTQKLYDKPKAEASDPQRKIGSRRYDPLRHPSANISLGSKISAKGNGMFRSNKFATKTFQDANKRGGMPKGLRSEDNETPAEPETFYVHHKDGRRVGGPYKSKTRARTAVDKFDNQYGGYAHHIRDNTGRTRF